MASSNEREAPNRSRVGGGSGSQTWAVSVPALFVVMMVTSMLALQV